MLIQPWDILPHSIPPTVLRSVISCGFDIRYVGVASAPEVMAYARKLDGFIYISASHNPIGHNGIKFGLNDGGVIDGEKSKVLIENFKYLCNQSDASEIAKKPSQKISGENIIR